MSSTVVAIQCASLAFASCNELHGQSSISSILAFLHLRISLLEQRLRFFVSLYSRWWPSHLSSTVVVVGPMYQDAVPSLKIL